MQKWSTRLIGVSIVLSVIGSCALLFWWLPPTEVEMHNHYTRWEQATETGDWETVWGMLSLPMPYGRLEERPHPREVERTMFEGLGHNDDHYTYAVGVTMTYRDPESQEIVKIQDLIFYLTQRQGRVTTWEYSTNEW